MAYYPIKCPYCLQELSNSDIKFNLRTGIAGRAKEIRDDDFASNTHDVRQPTGSDSGDNGWKSQALQQQQSAEDASFLTDDTPGWLSDESASGSAAQNTADGAIDSPAKQSKPLEIPTEGLFTLSELKRYFGDENVIPTLNKDVHAPLALANRPEFREDLLMGVKIVSRKDGKEITTTYVRRYCECEKELMGSAGMKAGYVLLMLGPTSSGKTMFLLALHKALKIEGGYLLPPDGSGSKGLAKLVVSVLSGGGRGEDTSLEEMSDKLFDDGKLPLSTFALDNEPLVLDISVLFKDGKNTNAMLFIRDMPGEFLTNPEKTEELHRIAHQFPLFDGFVMMLDPFTFTERSVFQNDGSADTSDREKLKFIDRLNQVLAGTIRPFAGTNRIAKPTAVIVTKGDHFFEQNNMFRLQQRGVERNFPTLTAYQKESYDRHYFSEIDNDVYRILGALSRNTINMLDGNFSNVFFSLVSALSKAPLKLETRKVTEKVGGTEAEVLRDFVVTPAAISPWRVSDPFIRMLMRLNIVPPFDEVEIRQPDMEDYDSALARNSRYLATINTWGRTYCSAWNDIAGIAVDPLPSQGGRMMSGKTKRKK